MSSPRESWPVCDHCGDAIPQFPELTAAQRGRVLALIRDFRETQAALEFSSFAGCSHDEARLWVSHRGRLIPVVPGPPCPSCGKALRTSLARQCFACGAGWHGD